MNFWMNAGILSLLGNAGLCLVLIRQSRSHRKEIFRTLTDSSSALQKLEKLSEDFAEQGEDLAAFSNSPLLGIFVWNEIDGPFTGEGFANALFAKMLGLELGESTHKNGLKSIQNIPPNLLPMDTRNELEVRSQAGPYAFEMKREKGSRINLVLAFKTSSRNAQQITCFALDVSTYMESRRELRRSEETYRALAQVSPMGIWNIRVDGTTIYLNPAMTTLLQLESPTELMATDQHFKEFFTPESLVLMEMEHTKRLGGMSSQYEVEVIGRYGKRSRMLVYGTPVLSADGYLDSMMGTFVDVTEKKREEEALRQSEERLRVAAECGHDLIYEWNLTSGSLDWFGPVESKLGFASHETPTTRKTFELLIHPEDRNSMMQSVERHLRSHEPFIQEYRVQAKDGSYRLWSDRGTALWDVSGKPWKWISSAADITEARNAESNLRTKEEELRQSQKLEAVGRLAGGIAHDFNNLLAAIMGYCELMLIKLEPEHACRKEVGEILNGSDRAGGLIRQLLAFSRQEIPQPKIIQPHQVIHAMERMLRHVLEENIELRFDLDENAGQVKMDPVQLEQVIMNLILNARDAMPGGGLLKIQVQKIFLNENVRGAYGKVFPGRHIKISVGDSGQGIEDEHLPHIFDPFYTTKHRGKGNGLGLSTVYGIITQNLGCILVETEISKGSMFSFFLPLTLDHPVEETEIKNAINSSSILSKTVLVVEDDHEVRGIVKELLSQKGFLVLEASNGREALSVVAKYDLPIHLLLTDVLMPEMGGKELADELGKTMPEVRVLFMSGYTQDSAFREDVAGGGRAFIQKPFSMGTLFVKIREVLT